VGHWREPFTLIFLALASRFDWTNGADQFIFKTTPMAGIGASFSLAADSISMLLVLLTVILHPLAVTASFRSIQTRSREHYAWMNLLLVGMLGVFVARDLLLFYMFFEFTLIPLFFIVGIWGGPERRAAAGKLFIYTFSASVFMLAAVIYLGNRAGSFDFATVIYHAQHGMSRVERFWVLLGLLAGLGVKTPIWPLHTWLPLAHTEAPTAGSVDLAALVLKLGTYGLIKLAIPIGLVEVSAGELDYRTAVLNVLAILCLVGIIYGALTAWAQRDVKKLVAYSSVSHLGFCVLGMLALNDIGMKGSMLYMINHGINTGALFLIIGMIYNRYHTRDMKELSGLGKAMPRMSFFMVLFVMASIGLPGTNGFVSEFLSILGMFTSSDPGYLTVGGVNLAMLYGIIAAIGIILGAVYLLHMTAHLLFGPLHYPVLAEHADTHETIHPKYVPGGDITGRECAVLTPLAVLVIVLGVFPTPVLRTLVEPLAAIRTPVGQVVAADAPAGERVAAADKESANARVMRASTIELQH
jgi:NADH-quinone oxidoreductase subunit M